MNLYIDFSEKSFVAHFTEEDMICFLRPIVNSDCVIVEMDDGAYVISSRYIESLIENGTLNYLGEL